MPKFPLFGEFGDRQAVFFKKVVPLLLKQQAGLSLYR